MALGVPLRSIRSAVKFAGAAKTPAAVVRARRRDEKETIVMVSSLEEE